MDTFTNSEMVIAMTTEADDKKASNLAKSLLERKLIACASFHQAKSYYVWEGKLEEINEVQILFKTTKNLLENLKLAIDELHSYENPEWLFWSVSSSKRYMSWVIDSVQNS